MYVSPSLVADAQAAEAAGTPKAGPRGDYEEDAAQQRHGSGCVGDHLSPSAAPAGARLDSRPEFVRYQLLRHAAEFTWRA